MVKFVKIIFPEFTMSEAGYNSCWVAIGNMSHEKRRVLVCRILSDLAVLIRP